MLRQIVLFAFFTLLSLTAVAGQNNNPVYGDKAKPTPYGLKIIRGRDALTTIEPDYDLPIAGLSLGLYLNSVTAAEQHGGAYSAELSEPLQDIGRAYQAENKHRQAMDYFRRALHLSRINEGLYAKSQLPLLSYMIESQLAMGQLLDVDDNYNYLFRVQNKVYEPGDPALLEATDKYTEWQRQAYLEGFAGNSYRRVVDMYDAYHHEIERIEKINPDDPALIPQLYQRMRAEYLLSQYEGEQEAEIRVSISNPLEGKFALSTDLKAQRFKYLKDFNYRNGVNTMQRIVDLTKQREDVDPMELARAKIAQGDWYMWWDTLARAIQCYERAWQILAEDGSNLTNPDALFREPVELPENAVFQPGAISATHEQNALATILFDVSRGGQARDVEIVEQDPAGDMGARITLFSMMKGMRFRPIVRDGKAITAQSVVRVYRYQY